MPQDLLKHVARLEQKYQQEKLDRDRETRFNRDIQIHEIELMDQISRIKNIMVRVCRRLFLVVSRLTI